MPFFISAVLVFVIFKIHMSSDVDSMLNEKNSIISNGFITSQIKYHSEFAPFARRPLTSYLVKRTSTLLEVSLGEAFVMVNFFLLFLSGLLLFRLSKVIGSGFQKGIQNLIIYFLSFTILFSFFPPIFSYDEPLQYCLIFAGLTSFLNKQWGGYIFLFSAAMIARENTIFVILGISISALFGNFSFGRSSQKAKLNHYLLIGIPVIFYVVFVLLYIKSHGLWEATHDEVQVRFSCFRENFKDMRSSVETIISLVVTLGLFIYFLLASSKHHDPSVKEKWLIKAFIPSCFLNTLIILLAAFSKEARLFAIPLVFLWPIMAQCCLNEFRLLLSFKYYIQCFKNWKYAVLLGFLTFMNYLISFVLYIPSFPSVDNYFNEYLFLSLQLIFIHYLLRSSIGRTPWTDTQISIRQLKNSRRNSIPRFF